MSEKKRDDECKSLVRTPAHVNPSTCIGIPSWSRSCSQMAVWCIRIASASEWTRKLRRVTMSEAACSRPQVNGILETSLYVARPTQSVEFYRRVFGFETIDLDQNGVTDETRLCPMRAGDRSVLLLFKKDGTADTNATGAIHVAFGISRSQLPA